MQRIGERERLGVDERSVSERSVWCSGSPDGDLVIEVARVYPWKSSQRMFDVKGRISFGDEAAKERLWRRTSGVVEPLSSS
jgi:hypothetical protein